MNYSSVEKTNSSNLFDALETLPLNATVANNFIIAYSKINSPLYRNIICSVSGGSDSDILVDICTKCDVDHKIKYVFIDTGLEYQATKEHIRYLEDRYHIKIEIYRPKKPIPVACKEHGQPFISKMVSEYMMRLQKFGFQWEDEPFEVLLERYPRCDSALKWWCNEKGCISQFNISRNKWLKEFIMRNPPWFPVSNKCCYYAKKKVVYELEKEMKADLLINGVRKAEGGARATAYKKTCFTSYDGAADQYRGLFFYKNADKLDYENACGIVHSNCYTEYGLKRTGCVGCPYGRDIEQELEAIKEFEPKLYQAVMNIFGDSYRYTEMYHAFCKEMNEKS